MKTRDHEIREGERFGMLTVIDVTEEGAIRCRCDCGVRKRFERASDVLRSKSCGCVRRAVPADEGLSPRQRAGNYQRCAQNGKKHFRFPWSVVEMIRNAPKTITTKQLADAAGMSLANASLIRRGMSRSEEVQR